MADEMNSGVSTDWPALPLAEWESTRATLHMWTQMVGKVRMALMPYLNHWWNVTLYVNSRGLTTSSIPCPTGSIEIQFDFLRHVLEIHANNGRSRELALAPRSVADFYSEFMSALASLGIPVKIWPIPVEIPNPIRFDQDHVHASYDREFVQRFWRVLLSIHPAFQQFRGQFLGKSSPVHFFWGSFDLAVTLFSGRRAPERPEADAMTREAYSHEVISVGFWPGNLGTSDAAFYAYAAPEPSGFAQSPVRPDAAFYNNQLSEFIMPYEAVRTTASPHSAILDFCESTYEVGADLGHWDRQQLERSP